MSADAYSVDVGGLEAGGVHLGEIQQMVKDSTATIQHILALGVTAFGQSGDVIGGPAFRAINPAQESAAGVFAGLTALIGGHVQNIGDAGKVTTDTNTSSTERAGRRV